MTPPHDLGIPPISRARPRWQEILRDLLLCLAAWTGGVAYQASWWALWSWVLIITVVLIIVTNPTLTRNRLKRRETKRILRS